MEKLEPAKPFTSAEETLEILSLTGGGVRGLFSISVLSEIEERKKCKISDKFTCFAGTSIGGILAIGLACGLRPKDMTKTFRKAAPKIFKRTFWSYLDRNNLFCTPYHQKPLREAITEILKENSDKTLAELEVPLIIPAVDHKRAQAHIFVSKPLAKEGVDDLDFKLIDVALATSAAPTYFPPHHTEKHIFLDGGLVANSPDIIALQFCLERLGLNLSELSLLSIGTASKRIEGDETIKAPGGIGWMRNHELFNVTIDSQSGLARDQVKAFLGSRYHRIDHSPKHKISLDNADETTLGNLEILANQAAEEFIINKALCARFL